MNKLLEKDPKRRLTSVSEIKAHPFFSGIDWRSMMKKDLRTPYKPLLDSTDDTKHFDQTIVTIPIDSPPCE